MTGTRPIVNPPAPAHHRAFTHAAALLRPFIALIVVVLVFFFIQWHKLGYTTDPDTLVAMVTLMDLRTVAIQTMIVGTAAIGMTLVIASGGLDLSVGSAVALCSVVAALAIKDGWPIALASVAAVLAGAACGLYNGVLVTVLRIPPLSSRSARSGSSAASPSGPPAAARSRPTPVGWQNSSAPSPNGSGPSSPPASGSCSHSRC